LWRSYLPGFPAWIDFQIYTYLLCQCCTMTTRYDLRNIYYTYQIGKCTLYRIDVANKSYAMYTRHHYRTQEPTLFYTFKSLDKRIVRKLKENTLEFFCLISNVGLIWLGN
jgi:hypothetical protein